MTMFARFVNRVWPRRLQRDLHDEVQFHIDMRANENARAGMRTGEATTKAHEQFGDVDAVLAAMRRERVVSPSQVLTMTACVVALALWLLQIRAVPPDLKVPPAPPPPAVRNPDMRSGSPPPPRPGPGPTWEQYVKQSKAFEALEKGPGRYSPGNMRDDKASR